MSANVALSTQASSSASAESAELPITPSVQRWWGREVNPYTAPLTSVLDTMPRELPPFIASYLEPAQNTPTELLVETTFCPFMEAAFRTEVEATARVWGFAVQTMDYSRVLIEVTTGVPPLATPNGQIQGGPTEIPLNHNLFYTLAARAKTQYFSIAAALVHPHGTYAPQGYQGAIAFPKPPAFPIPISGDSEVHDEAEFLAEAQKTAAPNKPSYLVTLDLLPAADAAPALRIRRCVGTEATPLETVYPTAATNETPAGT